MKRVWIVLMAVIFLFSGMAFAGYDEGMQLYREKKYVEAEAEFRKALPELTGKKQAQCQMYIGWSLRRQHKHTEAEAEFGKVKEVAGATSDLIANAEYHVAHSLLSLKRYDEARAKFLECLRMDVTPEKSAIYQLNVGCTFYAQKQYDEAIAEFAKIPKNASAIYYTALALRNQGKKAEAEAQFKALLKNRDARGYVNTVLNALSDISDMADEFVLQLTVCPKTEVVGGKEDVHRVRRALLKKASENPAVCRAIVQAMPTDLVVLAELKPFLAMHRLSTKEQAEIHLAIWKANLGQVVTNEDARAVVDGAVTALTQLLGLSENPSIAEVENVLAGMK